ncbi:MAG: hypothetical protein LBS59_06820, partial [Puniceicoccales bacterium]|nr:hypothetical protein [Puniceicoccales bacterium]
MNKSLRFKKTIASLLVAAGAVVPAAFQAVPAHDNDAGRDNAKNSTNLLSEVPNVLGMGEPLAAPNGETRLTPSLDGRTAAQGDAVRNDVDVPVAPEVPAAPAPAPAEPAAPPAAEPAAPPPAEPAPAPAPAEPAAPTPPAEPAPAPA